MKYFYLTNSTELEDIKHYPQVDVIYGFPVYDSKFNIEKEFIDKGCLKFDDNAIPTNLLDKFPFSNGLILDKRLKELLLKFKIPSHRFHKIKTEFKGEKLEYFWLNFVSSTRHLDLEKSEFEIINSTKFKIIGKLKLKSVEFYRRIENSLTFEENIRVSRFVLKDSFPNLDLMSFSELDLGVFINEKLKDKLIEEKITGIKITETDKITMHNIV